MDAKRCDRCGEYYMPDEYILPGFYVKLVPFDSHGEDKHLDLCDNCREELAKWVETSFYEWCKENGK